MGEVRVRVDGVVDDYLAKGDAAHENSNMGFGPNGLLFAVAGHGIERDTLSRMKDAGFGELADMHDRGAVHIHDLSMGHITPYCCGHSLANLLEDGVSSGVVSKPAKHFRTAINHIVNHIGGASNEFAGAQAFSDIDIYLAPYAYKAFLDACIITGNSETAMKLAQREVSQSVQELLFHLNHRNRWGGQTPFSNITMAITCPPDMKGRAVVLAGKIFARHFENPGAGNAPWFNVDENLTYGDLGFYQEMVVNAVLDTFLAGDAEGNGFTFPVLTINVTPEFFEHPVRHKVYELTAKFGTPFFQNFINGVSGGHRINPEDVRSMCCRLSINEKEIQKHVGGIFGAAEQTGSIQVITVSLPYLAAKCIAEGDTIETRQKFMFELGRVMNLCKDEMLWKRDIVSDCFKKGYYQTAQSNFKRGFDTFFTTVGFIGLWEAVEILTGDENSFLTPSGMTLAENILTFMKETVEHYTRTTKRLFNMEATPAESACYKLAKKAIKEFPSVAHRGSKKAPYFTNSCHLPVEYQGDLGLVFDTQSRLQTIPNGGTVSHFYTGEDLTGEDVETFVKTACGTPIPYFSITTIYSTCIKHGRLSGAHDFCPKCTDADAAEISLTRPDLVVEG